MGAFLFNEVWSLKLNILMSEFYSINATYIDHGSSISSLFFEICLGMSTHSNVFK